VPTVRIAVVLLHIIFVRPKRARIFIEISVYSTPLLIVILTCPIKALDLTTSIKNRDTAGGKALVISTRRQQSSLALKPSLVLDGLLKHGKGMLVVILVHNLQLIIV
jgi:hypothetical protein